MAMKINFRQNKLKVRSVFSRLFLLISGFMMSNQSFGQRNLSLTEIDQLQHVYYTEGEDLNPDTVYSLAISSAEKIPDNIGAFKNAYKISLFGCQNMNLEVELKKLKPLQNLAAIEIVINNSKTFPNALLELTQLKSIMLSGLQCETIPDGIGRLTELEALVFWHPLGGGCNLKELPSALSNLHKLHTLSLAGNLDFKINDNLYNLKSIRHLNLSYIPFELNSVIRSFPFIESFTFSETHAGSLNGIEKLNRLKRLEISYNETITSLGEHFFDLDSLEYLYIYVINELCNGEEITKISNLKSLKHLEIYLGRDCTRPFPMPQQGFNQLQTLRITTEAGITMGNIIGGLKRIPTLQHLVLGRFSDNELPAEIYTLTQLRELELQSIPIKGISADISKMELRHINLWNIGIVELPSEIADISGLEKVTLGSTKIDPKSRTIKVLKKKNIKVRIY